MAHAKDDNHAGHGLETGIDKSYDALDDAYDAHVLLVSATQWIILILGGLKLDSNGHTVLYYRLGESAAYS